MLFLSLHPHHVSLHSSIHISLSLSPNNDNNLNHPISLPIPKDSNSTIAPIKAPTPPWMKGPLLLQPHDILDFSKTHKRFNSRHVADEEKHKLSDKALIGKEVRGKKAMKRIAQKVEKLHNTENTQLGSEKVDNFEGYFEKLNENDDGSSSSSSSSSSNGRRSRRERMPWERDEKIVFLKMKKEKALTAAELNLDKVLLQKLRDEAAKMRKWVKVMKAGVTQDVVDEIKRIWRKNDLAMIKFDIPLCRNMDRAREIVETKTGGLVVQSKKDFLVVYRGCNHQLTSKGTPKIYIRSQRTKPSEMNSVESVTKGDLCWAKSDLGTSDMPSLNADHKDSISTGMQDTNFQPVSGSLYERETDRLLDGLGPRFIDWWMHKPLPVDADLLPEVVPGFKPPFRLCPPYESVKLADSELTYLRKLAQPLPTHFVLGTFLLVET
ncbi:hypothetical protein Lal_00017165 [Lupinus albus]|nr:hypothetical protein Lal_00017165 [Lupinus albus]